MKKTIVIIACLCLSTLLRAQTDTTALANNPTDSVAPAKIPFEGMDLSWINGQNRQTDFPLTLNDKNGETILTGVVFADSYYNYDFNNPMDNTHTASSSIGRNKEFTVNMVSIGVESYYKNIIGRVWMQFGQMGSIVQELDPSVNHGRNTSGNSLRYIRESAAGYHFNKWYGINVEMGIFMSYMGLESYVLNENWCYQRSMVCEFTPFYFSGARAQIFPSKKFKTEIWLINGWQTYNSWNSAIGLGSSNYYRPNENLQLVANFYFNGKDTRNSTRSRYHHDNSIVYRYYHNKESKGISQAALSINTHYGFETGDGAKPSKDYMTGTAISSRLWFCKNKLALTLRGDVLTNPGLYLAFSPSPVTPNAYTDAIAANPDAALHIEQFTSTFDIMPNDHITFRLEYGYRHCNLPYFAGSGGTTSPDGWIDTPTTNWRPDLRKTDSRITVVACFRL